MVNVIATAVIGLIVGAAAGYVFVKKKKGARCIGCPDSGTCDGNCSGCSSCH